MKSVFISYSQNNKEVSFVKDLKEELKTYGFDVKTIAENSYDISKNVLTHIKKCDLFIPVLSSQNENVFFELGFALGSRKQILIVCSPNIDLPSDLTNVVSVR